MKNAILIIFFAAIMIFEAGKINNDDIGYLAVIIICGFSACAGILQGIKESK